MKTQQPDPQSAEEARSIVVQEPCESAEEPKQQQAEGEQTSAEEAPAISPLTEAEAAHVCTPDARTGESLSNRVQAPRAWDI